MGDGWAVLGERILAERSRRWRTREDFAHATGVSRRVIGDLERGARSRYQAATLAAVESALGWSPGSCLRVVQGGRPQPTVDPLFLRLRDAWQYLGPDARRMLVVVAEQTLRERV